MATKQPPVGVDHPTVVPENYDADEDESAADVAAPAESDAAVTADEASRE